MLLGRNFDFLGGYLVVTARYLVVTTGYCSLPGGYCSLLVVAARYRLLVSVPTFSMNGEKVVIRTLAKLIEKLEAALPGIQHGRLYLWHLHQSKNKTLKKARRNFDSMCILDNNAQIELQWWEHNINNFNTIDQNVLPNIKSFSNACLTGLGATYNWHSTSGHWSVEESKSHINVLEMKGALFTLKIYCKEMYKVSLHFKIDNTSTIVWIRKETAPNKEIYELVKEFWEFCMERKLHVFASHIKSKRNKIADFDTRKVRENLE